jgi:hypothetical protein
MLTSIAQASGARDDDAAEGAAMTETGSPIAHLARSLGARGWSAVAAVGVAAGWVALSVMAWAIEPGLGMFLIVPSLSAIPIVAILGWLLGDWAAGSRSLMPLMTMALLIVPSNALVIALVLALTSAGDLLQLVAYALFFFAYGLLTFGLPALVIALPSAYVWLRLVREGFSGG